MRDACQLELFSESFLKRLPVVFLSTEVEPNQFIIYNMTHYTKGMNSQECLQANLPTHKPGCPSQTKSA